MYYTSIEQSKKLLKLGLNPESADMWYSYYGNSKYNPTIAYKGQQWFLCQIRNSLHDDIPCWSLGALLEVMPEQIIYSDFKPFPLGLFKGNKEEHSKYGHYWIQYFATDSGGAHIQTNGHSPIEAAYSMVVWLLENNYIKKEKI